MGWLAYAHPAAMLLVLALGMAVLREGLRVRRARLGGRSHGSARHRRLARVFVALVACGWISGVASMLLVRQKPPFESVHAWVASGAALCVGGAWALGRALERGRNGVRPLHAALGTLGLLLGLAAAIAAFAILP
jgi:hypothetical protein